MEGQEAECQGANHHFLVGRGCANGDGDGLLCGGHHNKREHFQGPQSHHPTFLGREVQNQDPPLEGQKGHARMIYRGCRDFQVHSADTRLREYPSVSLRSL